MPLAIPLSLTIDELAIVIDALDSHVYWELSDPANRSSGFVHSDDSADSDTAQQIRETTALRDRLESLHP